MRTITIAVLMFVCGCARNEGNSAPHYLVERLHPANIADRCFSYSIRTAFQRDICVKDCGETMRTEEARSLCVGTCRKEAFFAREAGCWAGLPTAAPPSSRAPIPARMPSQFKQEKAKE